MAKQMVPLRGGPCDGEVVSLNGQYYGRIMFNHVKFEARYTWAFNDKDELIGKFSGYWREDKPCLDNGEFLKKDK